MKKQLHISAPFQWGEESYATQLEAEKAISGYLADQLCNADLGSVDCELPGQPFNISVRVDILTPEGEKAVALIDAAPALLAYAEATEGLIAWAKDHGASVDFLRGLEDMRREAIMKAGGAS